MRPNILFITASNHRADCFGFEGRKVSTPHLDRLAAGGVRFSACMSPSHVGQPARASMLTGLLPLTHGVVDNGIDLDPVVAAGRLRSAAERCGLQHRTHRQGPFLHAQHLRSHRAPGVQVERRHLSGRVARGLTWGSSTSSWFRVIFRDAGRPLLPPYGLHYERWLAARGSGGEAHALWATALPPSTTAAQTWHSALPVAWHSSTWVADRTIEFIRTRRERQTLLCLDVVPGSALSVRLPSALEPAPRAG